MEYGLCCLFYKEPIRFRTYTLTNIKKLMNQDMVEAKKKVKDIVLHNINTLGQAFEFCRENDIASYRISSDIIPHLSNMQELDMINPEDLRHFRKLLQKIDRSEIILSMHPGQHVNMGSPHQHVVDNSVRDLTEHFWVAESVGCTEINIHVGGSYGDKPAAIKRFIDNMKERIPADKLNWITLENDELNYSVQEVCDVANKLGIRATYDIHHQKCYEIRYPEEKTIKENVEMCAQTWKGYGYQRLHLSSPKNGYTNVVSSRPHHDFIQIEDFPDWLKDEPHIHLDIEAKAKEEAILQLKKEISKSHEKTIHI